MITDYPALPPSRPVWRLGEIYPSDWVEIPREWLANLNPRRGRVERIAESIEVNGFFQTILLQRHSPRQGGPRVLIGNHRTKAGYMLGMTHFPVDVIDCSDEVGDRILIVDNRAAEVASWELLELCPMLQSFENLDGTGFTSIELEVMLAELNPPEPIEPPEHGPSSTDVQVRVGEISFTVTRDEYDQWYSTLRYEVGREDEAIQTAVLSRLGFLDG